MGRDRAKEKLQAHKKARLERKEAKTEQKELEKKNQKDPKGVKVQRFKDLMSRGDDGDHVAGGSEGNECGGNKGDSKRNSLPGSQVTSGGCSSSAAGSSKAGNAEGGDNGTCNTPSENSEALSTSSQVPHVVASGTTKKEGKGKNPGKSFPACPNPNRGKIRPIWRLALEDAAVNRSKKSISKSKKRAKVHEYTLQDMLKANECRTLKEILDVTLIDEITHEVAAVVLGRFDLVKKLVNDGYFTNRRAEGKEFTPMNCAIQQKNWEMIEFLVDKNLCVHCKDKFRNTPLIKAVLRPEWTAQLMHDLWMMYKFDERTDLTSSNKAGVNFVHGLAYRGWHEVLNDVLQFMQQQKAFKLQIPALINAQIWNGFTPLTIAVVVENIRICELLLSNGASPLIEDKAGFTPFCHAIYLSSRTPTVTEREGLHPIFLLMVASFKPGDWTLKSFITARFNCIASPPSDSVFVDLFYMLGRPLFSFIVRWTPGGAEMLLSSKMFSKLTTAGLRHFQRTDFIHALCSIIFETLVYAEDRSSAWPKFVKAFLEEGGAEFCLRVLQRPQCDINEYIGTNEEGKDRCRASSTASVSDPPKSQDIADVPESMGFLMKSPPPHKNLGLAAILPLIQVVDSSDMFAWFGKHFQCISRCYTELVSKGSMDFVMSVSLTPEHTARTRQKALLFSTLMFREEWVNPNDLMSGSYVQHSDSRKSRKNKKLPKPLPRRLHIVPERLTRDVVPKEREIDLPLLRKVSSKSGLQVSAPEIGMESLNHQDVSLLAAVNPTESYDPEEPILSSEIHAVDNCEPTVAGSLASIQEDIEQSSISDHSKPDLVGDFTPDITPSSSSLLEQALPVEDLSIESSSGNDVGFAAAAKPLEDFEEKEVATVQVLEENPKLPEPSSSFPPAAFKDNSMSPEERIIRPLYPISTTAFQEEAFSRNHSTAPEELNKPEVRFEPSQYQTLAIITDSNCQTVLHPMTIRSQRSKVGRTNSLLSANKQLSSWFPCIETPKRRISKLSMYEKIAARVKKTYRRKRVGLLFEAEKVSMSKSPDSSTTNLNSPSVLSIVIEKEDSKSKASFPLSSAVSEDEILFRDKATQRSVRVQATIKSSSSHTTLVMHT